MTTTTWFLIIFLFKGATIDSNYVDKVAIPMTGKMEQMCRPDAAGILRYVGKLEGTDYHKTVNVCVTAKHWRGEE